MTFGGYAASTERIDRRRPEAKGTKPLFSGPKMDGVRNMKCSFFRRFRGAIVASPSGFSTSRAPRVRAACVR